jgi:hypothetical protein
MLSGLGTLAPQRRVIDILTSGVPATLIDIGGNPANQILSGGHAYGAWIDGNCCPYIGSDGETYVILPAPENYRIAVNYSGENGWNNGSHWGGLALAYESPRNALQSQYSNRLWIFGVYASGSNVWTIAHDEWYNQMETDDGYAGFNAWDSHQWVTAPVWIKSTDNGATWALKSTAADRPILKPEPYGTQDTDALYGFRHGSNIVRPSDVGQPDDHFYMFLDYTTIPSNDSVNLLRAGVCLVRTSDIDSSTNWEYWNGSGWTAVNRGTYQGNLSTQVPHHMWEATGWDPYTINPRTTRMGQSIRWHEKSKQWYLFGYRGDKVGVVCATRSPSLENPRFETTPELFWTLASGDAVGNYTGARYISVFDPDTATDQNFTTIGDNPICITVGVGRDQFMKNKLILTTV